MRLYNLYISAERYCIYITIDNAQIITITKFNHHIKCLSTYASKKVQTTYMYIVQRMPLKDLLAAELL